MTTSTRRSRDIIIRLRAGSIRTLAVLAATLFVIRSTALATAIPALISYQGRLTAADGTPIANGVRYVEFALYADSVGGPELWSEGSEVMTIDGLFTHLLGSSAPLAVTRLAADSTLFLEVRPQGLPTPARVRLTSVPFAQMAGGLEARDSQGRVAIEANPDTRRFTIFDSEAETALQLRVDTTGDSAAILPEGAISSPEILDEPGVVTYINIYPVTLVDMEMTDLVTVEIQTPADGYIVLEGKCYAELSGTTGPNVALVQIDEHEGGGSAYPYYTLAGLGGYVNTSANFWPIYLRRIYFKKAGTYEFRMEGRASYPPPAAVRTWDHVLTATFYPTGYGPVYDVVSDPSGFRSARSLPGIRPIGFDTAATYYEVDLRELEAQTPSKDSESLR